MKKSMILLIVLCLTLSCKKEIKKDAQNNEPKKVENKASEEWIQLFDGVSTKGWRAYNGDALPPGWIVKDSVLTFDTELGLEQDYKGGKDIIYGDEEFDNFELYVEWKIPEGGNSGIFYHLKENIPNAGPPNIAPEYQLIDDENYAKIHSLTEYNTSLGYENPSELHPLQSTAADYAMYPANPENKQLNPTGEWNSTRILFTPEKAEYWLNGKKVVEFVPWSEDWYAKKNTGKWKEEKLYGTFKTGYIGFQDHSSPIWFRNIKIKKL
ncbi:3-keto-disaccharide hydrolase [Aureibaculum luteum]|uniref:3-keto-disaccharide hydrolase n=1 Tax=Aureibaculum luteum TaxID=1548456 RepID=UPI000E4F8908|nr:DUF1080 domain-containing protein [Aureibaculum luteum]